MAPPRFLRVLLAVCISALVAVTFFGAYFLDRRFLLLLLPPSLTYFLLDAVRDARRQKALQAALDAKKAVRDAAEAAGGGGGDEDAPAGVREARKEGVNYKKTRRARAA
jgi:hypothetical protein